MNEFFEVNLPDSAPGYLVGAQLRKDFEAAVASIKRRSAKLNAALNSSVMEPNKFHAIAKTVFDMNPVRFDSMSVDELTGICEVLDDGEPVIPREEWPAATVLFDTAFTLTSEWVWRDCRWISPKPIAPYPASLSFRQNREFRISCFSHFPKTEPYDELAWFRPLFSAFALCHALRQGHFCVFSFGILPWQYTPSSAGYFPVPGVCGIMGT